MKMIRSLVVLLLLLLESNSWADTHTAANCTQSAVASAVSAATSGDSVAIPACSETAWSTPVAVSNKSLTIYGAGQGVTNLATSTTNAMFTVSENASYSITIKDMTINGNAGGPTNGLIQISGGTPSLAIGNITFNNLKSRAISVSNNSYGVIYSCIFNYGTGAGTIQAVSNFGGGVFNSTTWSSADNFGSSNFLFVENCTFNWSRDGDSAFDAYGGARFVLRHNTVNENHFGWHGLDSGGYFAPRAWEVYDNTFTMNTGASPFFTGINIRGGTGVIYNNTWGGSVGYSPNLRVTNYRSCNSYTYWQQCNNANWKACSNLSGGYISACTSDSTCSAIQSGSTCSWYWNEGRTAVGPQDSTYNYYFDINNESGYPCVNQVGRGQNNTLSPAYEWNNLNGATDVDYDNADGCSAETNAIQANRDFYNDTQKPGYTSYTYPHPLRGADTTPPTLSALAPSGSQSCTSDPLNVTETLTTSKLATCRAHDSATTWLGMTQMTTTGGTSHSRTVSRECGRAYSPNVICQDSSGNESAMSEWSYQVGDISARMHGGHITKLP